MSAPRRPGAEDRRRITPVAVMPALVVPALALLGLAAGCGSPAAGPPPSPTARPATSVPTTTTLPPPAVVPATTAPAAVPTTTGAAPGTLAVGPGAQATYTVESQPAPGTCHYRWEGPDPLPDPACTPGVVNPSVTQADIASTICVSGWTATVRPPTSVTGPEKVGSAAAYGYTGSSTTAEYDHLVPLELGGDPNDPANLWLEPNDRPGATSFANSKDSLEDRLHSLVCSGQLPLATAQLAIATDWPAALQRYGG